MSERDQPIQLAKRRQRMLASLGKPDSRVEDDPLRRNAGRDGRVRGGAQLGHDLPDRIASIRRVRIGRHIGNVATRVHQDNPRPRRGADPRHLGVEPEGGHVVDDRRARIGALLRDPRLHRVDRNEKIGMIRRGGENDRNDPVQLFVRAHGHGALWARRLAADVDHVGALGDHLIDQASGIVDGLKPAAVAEAVGCDVDDSDDARDVE
jgi:hypothetical protein